MMLPVVYEVENWRELGMRDQPYIRVEAPNVFLSDVLLYGTNPTWYHRQYHKSLAAAKKFCRQEYATNIKGRLKWVCV